MCDEEANSHRLGRFEARPRLTPATRRRDDPNFDEAAIFEPASGVRLGKVEYPGVSTFCPCAAVMMYLAQSMDNRMASTKRWTDCCMGWVPPYTQIYLSMLFYIQTMRAMRSAGLFCLSTQYLDNILDCYPPQNLWIPGPLVQLFKNLASFRPSSGHFGNVTPALPKRPGWSRKNRYCFDAPHHTHLPNISLFISRLRSDCAVAAATGDTKQTSSTSSFINDADGPARCATLYGRPCDLADPEARNMLSPGAQFALAGRLKLWINAARQLQDNGIPPDLDLNKDEVEDTWTAALKLDTSGVWFSHIAAMMGKYCQFWRGSASLADCSPNSSATGSVKCIMTGEGSSIFDSVKWVCSADALNDSTHMNAGHYLLRTYRHLVVSASTTVGDITDDHVHAALTYYLNLSPNSIEFHGLTAGKFWKIVPDVLSGSHISTLTGVISAIHRHYHRETPE